MYNAERIPKTSIDQNSDGAEDKDPRRPSRRIVLHFDLNNTILVSDAVTRQGTVGALEYFLSTVTWGRMTKGKTTYFRASQTRFKPSYRLKYMFELKSTCTDIF